MPTCGCYVLHILYICFSHLANLNLHHSSSCFCSIFLICRAVSELSIPCLTANRIMKYASTKNRIKTKSGSNDTTGDELPNTTNSYSHSLNAMTRHFHSPYHSSVL